MRLAIVGMLIGSILGIYGPAFAERLGVLAPGEYYVTEPQGPYRGRVVDDATGQAVGRALILAVWQTHDAQIEGLRGVVALRETSTDAEGRFEVDGSEVETRPPLFLLPPRLVIYKADYMPHPEEPRFPLGALGVEFCGRGQTVRLRPARDEEARILASNVFFATLSRFGIHGDLDAMPPGHPRLELLKQTIIEEYQHFGFVVRGGYLIHRSEITE